MNIKPTFKQFLHLDDAPASLGDRVFIEGDDPLRDVEYAMHIKKMIPSLSAGQAITVWDWLDTNVNHPVTYDDLPDEVADKIANSEVAETDVNDDDISHLADHQAAPMVRNKMKWLLRKAIEREMVGEGQDPLLDTQIEMFFRHELELPRLEANEAMLWITGDKDWMDLEGDTRDHVLDYVSNHFDPNIFNLNSTFIPSYCEEELVKLMRDEYGIEL